MASVAHTIHCRLRREVPPAGVVQVQQRSVVKAMSESGGDQSGGGKNIMLQPRLCTLRSYGSEKAGVIKTKRDGGGDAVSPFFETLSEYIESSKKSHDFEIISGRLAMIVFAATVTNELVTGNSVFRKMDMQWIAEAGGVCLGAVAFAAIFAWFSSARTRVGRIFTLSCNTFIDSLIDQIVDGLFYESELNDWSDEI
ncbi:stress enhanced protein 2, chloroplastic [Melia azedarach]|uniref:Stress enhanced protein 2, chloroplastic n=1 Tax=Melia azedarach TaxID=155640 RepID=A0ACC1XVY4_MELAZ|nr:stress enhanced protein 2, chloroplastic [Melia azedarach]